MSLLFLLDSNEIKVKTFNKEKEKCYGIIRVERKKENKKVNK